MRKDYYYYFISFNGKMEAGFIFLIDVLYCSYCYIMLYYYFVIIGLVYSFFCFFFIGFEREFSDLYKLWYGCYCWEGRNYFCFIGILEAGG